MKLNGSYEIAAPPEAVWRALTQPESLKGCIPGCQRLEDVGDGNYEAAISAQLGPVRGNFNAKVSIKDWNPPRVLPDGGVSHRRHRLRQRGSRGDFDL